MGIKKLFFETAFILTLVTIFLVTVNSLHVHYTVSRDLNDLQKQYLNATFEIYKSEILGDVLVGDKDIINTILKEITDTRNVGAVLTYDNTTLYTGNSSSQYPMSTYDLNLGNGKHAKIDLYSLKNLQTFSIFNTLLIPLMLELLVSVCGFLWLLRRMKRKLLSPLNNIVSNLSNGSIERFFPTAEAVVELKQLSDTLKQMTNDLKKKALYEAEVMAAKQVAHDIRSPLAGLNWLLSHATSLPEKQRVSVRASIQRIRDIANVLQNKAKQLNFDSKNEDVMISSALELLVTEKRMQLGLETNIRLDLNLDNAYGLFCSIDAIEFKRMISNLIDNSFEACDGRLHHVLVEVAYNHVNQIIINIDDDGKGIPPDLIKKIGVYGFTYGKDGSKASGSGLGIYHAIKTVEAVGGSFSIDSKIDVGTKVTIALPRSSPPEWFVNNILLNQIKSVIVIDDDKSIHYLWDEKLEQKKLQYGIQVVHFCSIEKFENFFFQNLSKSMGNVLFLIDYEFVGQKMNGLELIEKFNLNGHAVLITSHHEDINIRAKAVALNTGIIPKGIVSYIPLL